MDVDADEEKCEENNDKQLKQYVLIHVIQYVKMIVTGSEYRKGLSFFGLRKFSNSCPDRPLLYLNQFLQGNLLFLMHNSMRTVLKGNQKVSSC